jgi:GTP cyclohydrolase FolE2
VALALSRAGVTGVQKAIRIRRGAHEIVMAAELECSVDLPHDQKGVHMSRFAELFDEVIDDAVLREALQVEALAARISSGIVERQEARRAEARITARWPIRRAAPVSGLPTQEMVSLIGIGSATRVGSRRVVGVERPASTRAPAPSSSCGAAPVNGSPRPGSQPRTWSASSTSSRTPRTTSGDAARSSSARSVTSTPRISSRSSSIR